MPLPLLRAYFASRHGGAMLVAATFVILTMATLGSLMVDYAWREAQWAEIRGAIRAAVASAGNLIERAADPTVREEIKEKVATFASGLVQDFDVDAADVRVSHDADTGTTTVVVGGTYPFDSIWGADGDPDPVADTVRVRQRTDLAEIVFVVDVSGGMFDKPFYHNPGIMKIGGLRRALHAVTDTNRDAACAFRGIRHGRQRPAALTICAYRDRARGRCTLARRRGLPT